MELASVGQLDDFKCALCQNLLREPQLNDCCGEHLCRACVDKDQPCPLCNSLTFQVIPDKKLARRMERAKIKCSMHDQGCDWVGKLENLESHLDPTSGDCGYIHVNCTNACGGRVLRHQLPSHLERDCPRRRCSCQYCGCSASYENICTKHVAVCKKYPVPCPNECSVGTVERCCLEQHLQNECLLQEADCDFSHAGCTTRLRRRDVEKHAKENIQEHLRLLSIKFGEACVRLEQKEKQLDQVQAELRERDKQMEQQSQQIMRIEKHMTKVLARLKAQDQEMCEMKLTMEQHNHLIARFREHNVNECEESVHMEGFEPEPQLPWPLMQDIERSDPVKIPEGINASDQGSTNSAKVARPFYPSAPPLTEFKFYMHRLRSSSLSRSPAKQGYNPQQKSPVFYTSREGYMMQVHVYDNTSSGRGVSVYVYICRGEYDDTLEWPLSASITVTLVNTNRTQQLHSKTLTGKWNRVTKPGMMGEHTALHPFATSKEVNDCLRDNCLHFEVTCVDCYPTQ